MFRGSLVKNNTKKKLAKWDLQTTFARIQQLPEESDKNYKWLLGPNAYVNNAPRDKLSLFSSVARIYCGNVRPDTVKKVLGLVVRSVDHTSSP